LNISALIHNHKQSVVLLAGLLLIAAQLVSLVHAAEHPFHDHDEICEILSAVEKHDTGTAVVAPAAGFSRYSDELNSGDLSGPATTAVYSYPARGPPAFT
jgi:hypothetical protein